MQNRIYYIYHIPGVKIGCTDDLPRRMKAQKAIKYEILETHTDEYIASDREQELQKQYGYPVDKIPYYKIIKMPTKEGRSKGGKKQIENLKKYNSDKKHQSIAGRNGGKKRAATITFEELSYAGKIGGAKNKDRIGKWAVESGHLSKIQKISAERRKKSILQFDLEGNFIKEWKSIIDASTELGLHATSISVVCRNGRQKTCGGYTFKYK